MVAGTSRAFLDEVVRADSAAVVSWLSGIWHRRVRNDAAVPDAARETPDGDPSDILRKRYERVVRRGEQITRDDIFEVFMNSFAHVFDPHSSYFSPRNSEEYRIQMSLSHEGLGASRTLVDDYVTVLNARPTARPRSAAQLSTSDRIIAVAEGRSGKPVDVIGRRLEDVAQIIRGTLGAAVRLQILPAGAAPGSPGENPGACIEAK